MGLSNRAYARSRKERGLTGGSESAVRKAVSANRIPVEPDGSIDPDKADAAWQSNTDPARAVRHEPAHPEPSAQPVRTIDDAEEAVALIRQVLAEEGREIDGAPTFDDVRTAETILKSRERAFNLAVQKKEFTPTRPALKHVEEAFSNYKRELLSLPARYGAELAAACGGDVAALDRALSKVIREHLDGLSAPVVRT